MTNVTHQLLNDATRRTKNPQQTLHVFWQKESLFDRKKTNKQTNKYSADMKTDQDD